MLEFLLEVIMIRTFTMYFLFSFAFCFPAIVAMESEYSTQTQSIYEDLNGLLSLLPVELFCDLEKFCTNNGNYPSKNWALLRAEAERGFTKIYPGRIFSQIYLTMRDSADNQILVGSLGESIEIIKINGESKFLYGHEHQVTCMAYHYKSKTKIPYLFSGSKDQKVKIWNLNHNGSFINPLQTLEGHNQTITCLLFDESNNLLFSGDASGAVKVWDGTTFKLINTLEGHSQPITGLVVDPATNYLYAASNDGTIEVWDIVKKTFINRIQLPNRLVNHRVLITLNTIEHFLYCCSALFVYVYDLETGTFVDTINNDEYITQCIFDASRNRLITSSNDFTNSSKIWDLSTKTCIYDFCMENSVPPSICFDSEKNILFMNTDHCVGIHLEDDSLKKQLDDVPLEDKIAQKALFDAAYKCYKNKEQLNLSTNALFLYAYNTLPREIQKGIQGSIKDI